jgi:hypothetical protein
MLVDAPDVVETDGQGQGQSEEIKLTTDNADRVLEMINKINR